MLKKLFYLKYNAAVLKVIYCTIAFWKQISDILRNIKMKYEHLNFII